MYGNAPKDLGVHTLYPKEMLFWMYCPIKRKNSKRLVIPPNLAQFAKLVHAVQYDIYESFGEKRYTESYLYLTAKRLFVQPGAQGNRLGWHADGFGTNDLNYIWYDANPTIFYVMPRPFDLSPDHHKSMEQMTLLAENMPHYQRRYPTQHLLRLDQSVIHAVEPNVEPGMRTFVKVSVSDQPYALEGNSVNHALDLGWDYTPRAVVRNCPQSNMKDHA